VNDSDAGMLDDAATTSDVNSTAEHDEPVTVHRRSHRIRPRPSRRPTQGPYAAREGHVRATSRYVG
jgi:hypothetical protein